MKKYLSSYPHLVKAWHPTKNRGLNKSRLFYKYGKTSELDFIKTQ